MVHPKLNFYRTAKGNFTQGFVICNGRDAAGLPQLRDCVLAIECRKYQANHKFIAQLTAG